MKRPARRAVAAAAFVAAGLAASSARAERTLIEGDDSALHVGGYVRSVGAVSRLAVDLGELGPERIASTAFIGRLEWRANLGRVVGFDLHQRLQLRGSAGGGGLGDLSAVGPGAGTSVAPDRRLDTRTRLGSGGPDDVDLLDHDLDRAALRLYLGAHDVIVGRQAIGWGRASVFAATDLFGRLSPLDVDNTQKRGVDAARWLVGVGRAQLDVFVGDGGPDYDVIGGARVEMYLDRGDVEVGLARLRDEVLGLFTTSIDLGSASIRGEVVVPLDTRTVEVAAPSATLGYDHLWPTWTVSVEVHHNQEGTTRAGELAPRLEAIAAGTQRSPFAGRWLASAQASWQANPTLRLSTVSIVQLTDPSALVSLAGQWDPAQDVELSLAAFHGFGRTPSLATASLRSEFGAYGTTVLAGVVAWF